jgi:hypothetical protein
VQPHRHDHEWGTSGQDSPLIDDGGAIFIQQCRYTEGEYGQAYQCDETRSVRFEYGDIQSPDGEIWQVPEITEWDADEVDLPEHVAQAVLETEFEGDVTGVDPDPEYGEVALKHDGWTLTFRP